MSLQEARPDLYDRLVEMIHILTDKSIRKMTKDQALYIDWDEIARCMKGDSDSWISLPPVVKPCQTEPKKPSRFDTTIAPLDQIAPKIERDAPRPISIVRGELNDLIREHGNSPAFGWGDKLSKLLGIVEQIVMRLENPYYAPGPAISVTPGIPCGPSQPIMIPAGPTFIPQWNPDPAYIGDPPFPGSTTICSTRPEVAAMSQADGHVAGYEDAKTERYPEQELIEKPHRNHHLQDIPF